MKRRNATRNALLMSVLAMLLCVTMLVGTTYAWFTDTASTGINTITAGNLDIEVLYAYPSDVVDGEIPDNAWKVVDAQTPVFNQNALWEPGYTEIVYFKYVNKGTLSLQFQMHVDIVRESQGLNVAGELFSLSDYIEAYVCGAADYQFELYETRDEALNPPYAPEVWHGSLKEVANMGVATPDDKDTWLSLDTWNWLEPGEEYYTTLVLFMPTTVGNEANYGQAAPSIDLGINFIATQYNWENEKDSFDHNYDENAEYPTIPEPIIEKEPIVLGDNYPTDQLVSFIDTEINNPIVADVTYPTITFDGVSGNLKFDMQANNTLILEDCEFDSLEVINNTGRIDVQIIFANVTVNGVKITDANKTDYFKGFEPTNIMNFG